jgi:alkylated DNA repair protein (DNA oxidative demethylase)
MLRRQQPRCSEQNFYVVAQPRLFGGPLPAGFEYRPDFVPDREAQDLRRCVEQLEFSNVEMRGAVARRRTAHFGWTYGYERRRTEPGAALPEFLLPLRARVADWAGLVPDALAEALVTEYPERAAIGWHRDAPMFGDVAGISLGAACRMKFRPYVSPKDVAAAGVRQTTHEIELAPGSGYLIRGEARRDFEHSIPPVEKRRYSITFRTVRR